MNKIALLFVALVLLSGCATNIQVRQDVLSSPEPGNGYIAGGFLNSYRESFARLALELHNTSTDEAYLIELQQPENHIEIEVFPFAPGTYKISNLVLMGGIGDCCTRMPVDNPQLMQAFQVEENEILFIGHFDGKSTNEITSIGMIGTFAWVTTDDTYSLGFGNRALEDVSTQLQAIYPAYAELPITRAFTLEEASQWEER